MLMFFIPSTAMDFNIVIFNREYRWIDQLFPGSDACQQSVYWLNVIAIYFGERVSTMAYSCYGASFLYFERVLEVELGAHGDRIFVIKSVAFCST